MVHGWISRTRTERGAGLVEYSLLIAAIALVCLIAVEAFGGNVDSTIETSGNSIAAATP
jgi:Flp pilus assembly pilin Flp